MSERYSKVYSLEKDLYCQGAPVVIQAGSLLKDNKTGKVLVQLKFQNISPQIVKALTVRILAEDIYGKMVEGVEEYQYLDLNVARNDSFGQKVAIPMPSSEARTFSCQCLSAVFVDGEVWRCDSNARWNSLPQALTLNKQLGAELAEQYQRDTTPRAEFVPAAFGDLWRCTCGSLNNDEKLVCNLCHSRRETVFNALNVETLKFHKQRYDEQVACIAADAEKERVRKKKRIICISAVAVTVMMIFAILTVAVFIPYGKYYKATVLMQQGDFTTAKEIYLEVQDISDAKDRYTECEWREAIQWYIGGNSTVINKAEQQFARLLRNSGEYPDYLYAELGAYFTECAKKYIKKGDYASAIEAVSNKYASTVKNDIYDLVYQEANQKLETSCYDEAHTIFNLLGNFLDSETLAKESLYRKADMYYASKNYESANPIFEALGNYKDSKDKIHYHTWKLTASKKVSCTESGYKNYYCEGCKQERKETETALGHKYSGATCTKASICSRCGDKEKGALGHTTSTGVCSRCNYNFTAPLHFSGTLSGSNNVARHYITLPYGTYRLTVTLKNEERNKEHYYADIPFSCAIRTGDQSPSSMGGYPPAIVKSWGELFRGADSKTVTEVFTAAVPQGYWVGISHRPELSYDFEYEIIIEPVN